MKRALALLTVAGALLCVATAGAAARNCGSVSYTYPGTGGHGHEALNNLTAVGVSCRVARAVAKHFIVHNRAPKSWHAVAVDRHHVSEEILTRGAARVTGDIAN